MKNIIVITGASSGFGALAARALAIRWEEVFRAQGMKNPTPRIQMIEGFNEGWIEFEGGFESSVKGQTSLKTVLEEMVRDARKQAA
jgi:hypothetical protein